MRVLMTTDTVGGVWTFTQELAEYLLNREHTVALVSFGSAPSEAQQAWTKTVGASHGERFTYVPSDAPLEWMQANDRSWAGADVLAAVAERLLPDVVHGNQFCWGALAMGVPCVVTAHSDVLSWAEACRGETLKASEWLARYTALVQDGLDGAAAVVAPTQWMLGALQKNFCMAARTQVIPNGRTLAQHGSGGARALRAVSAGRLWDEAKGLATLREMRPAMPVFVAGGASFENANAGSDGVHWLGHLDARALHAFFQRSSVYIAPSLYEPFGLAPLEAALCGCALLLRDLASFREVWGDAAIYFESSAAMEEKIDELAEDAAFLREMQGLARERAETYTAEGMGRSYGQLYTQVCGSSAATKGVVAEANAA